MSRAACYLLVTNLSRRSRNQTGSFGHTYPSAVRAILDDPPIHIRPDFPAIAGAKQKNPVGSSQFGPAMIASPALHCHQILLTSCRESVRKGLITKGSPTGDSAPADGRSGTCNEATGVVNNVSRCESSRVKRSGHPCGLPAGCRYRAAAIACRYPSGAPAVLERGRASYCELAEQREQTAGRVAERLGTAAVTFAIGINGANYGGGGSARLMVSCSSRGCAASASQIRRN